ncbi:MULTISPECIES: type IV pilin-like G/H family protein [Pseudanabaena]|uniref:General secretion pathway protein H n=2 Tax=Pseudanabaena TaxID=1152 RepID=L8N0E4_9CYAN|nr:MULTISPECIES: type IV pilin-like G/H family protein [Pseudanabaena]ELS33687.1 general secretion pathway protein H [Pseudanabaena biceps PCC 7429]MDG3494080.1 type IV pilin-like G/H family protein [Pseudanabaena catenata USMAC16]
MKSEFKTKLIQHILNKKNGEKGFTLIELLVVIIIIGILAAIALPSFLNQASKARQSEAKTYVGSLNRGQQAYYLEKQQFAPSLATLAVGVALTTANYGYTTGFDTTSGALVAGKNQSTVTSVAIPGASQNTPGALAGAATSNLKGYIGGVSISTPTGSNEATSLATLCEQNLAPVNSPAATALYTTSSALTFAAASAPACTITGPAVPSTSIQ